MAYRPMRAGEYDQRIALQRRDATLDTRDTSGGLVPGFVTVGEVWARKLSERGIETFAGQAQLGAVDVGFAIRNTPGLQLDQRSRFQWGGRWFGVVSVAVAEGRAELILLGTGGKSDGW